MQTATIASALPFSVVLLIAIWGLFKALHIDSTKRVLRHQSPSHYSRQHKSAGGWQRRLRSMVMFPRRSHVKRFIDEVVLPAFEEVAAELRKQGYVVEVMSDEEKRSKLEVQHNQEVNFVYEVRPRAYVQPDFVAPDDDQEEESEERKYFRAEIHLLEGGQDYDIKGGHGKRSLTTSLINTNSICISCTWCVESRIAAHKKGVPRSAFFVAYILGFTARINLT